MAAGDIPTPSTSHSEMTKLICYDEYEIGQSATSAIGTFQRHSPSTSTCEESSESSAREPVPEFRGSIRRAIAASILEKTVGKDNVQIEVLKLVPGLASDLLFTMW